MAEMYWVDLPNHVIDPDDDTTRWVNIAKVKTREDARILFHERYGMTLSDEQLDVFITEDDDYQGEQKNESIS